MRNFDLPGKSSSSEILIQSVKRNNSVLANIIVHPVQTAFDYYVIVEEAGVKRLKLWVYTAEMNEIDQVHPSFKIRWKNDDALVISIPSKQIEISVSVSESKAMSRDLTPHMVPPPFDMSRTRADMSGTRKPRMLIQPA